MQRRLTLALVATAVAAIVLVGLGVLGFASIGAERDAEQRLEAQLDAVVELVERTGRPSDIGPAIGRLGDAFDGSTIDVGLIGPNGNLRAIRSSRGEPSAAGPPLESDDVSAVEAGETVYTRVDGRLRGIRRIDVQLDQLPQATGVVIIQTNVATIGREARLWFLVSASIVLFGAAAAAAALAKRFVRPIRQATEATAAIASGDLGVRVPVAGSDELAALGTGINEMAAELERGRAAEQQFLLSVSHDLRTPLTALRGYGEALEDGTATDTARAGAVISHHAQRLGRLVGDLLDLGKLEARQFRFDIQTIDAADVVTAAANGAHPVAEERGLNIVVAADTEAFVAADPDRLGQIVANLIENALAFARTSIDVSVETVGGEVQITVGDDGPGIAEADLPHVFDRLYVTKLVPDRSETPSGLGLAIVRELSHAMGGSVAATRGARGGTAMVVRLPGMARST